MKGSRSPVIPEQKKRPRRAWEDYVEKFPWTCTGSAFALFRQENQLRASSGGGVGVLSCVLYRRTVYTSGQHDSLLLLVVGRPTRGCVGLFDGCCSFGGYTCCCTATAVHRKVRFQPTLWASLPSYMNMKSHNYRNLVSVAKHLLRPDIIYY